MRKPTCWKRLHRWAVDVEEDGGLLRATLWEALSKKKRKKKETVTRLETCDDKLLSLAYLNPKLNHSRQLGRHGAI